jgi:hypothetical protein
MTQSSRLPRARARRDRGLAPLAGEKPGESARGKAKSQSAAGAYPEAPQAYRQPHVGLWK